MLPRTASNLYEITMESKAQRYMKILDLHTLQWIADRVDNREPLMWSAFVSFMKGFGVDKETLQLYRSRSYKLAVKKVYDEKFKSMKSMSWHFNAV